MTPFRLENQFKSEITQTGGIGEERIIFLKPHTYMNLSGEAIKKVMNYYKIGTDDLWVVCDDLNLELGTIRVRTGGEDGGHNGLKSIIASVDHDFWRLRVGIGSNHIYGKPAEAYVLERFTPEEHKKIDETIDRCAQVVISSLSSGILREETLKI
jgi:PTH1 family peptidyl-tRNA hydrolase